jgi:uncharacterized protein
MFRKALAALVLMLALPLMAGAQGLPDPLSDTVSDFSGVLGPDDKARISAQLQGLRDETGVHMVVVTIPTLEAHGGAGMRLDAYGKALFNRWGIGDPTRNDGLLLLVVTEAREVRFALGAGYDAVYDGRALRVLDQAVLPAFKEGRMAGGIEAGITLTRDQLIAPHQAGRPVTEAEGFRDDSWLVLPILGFIASVFGLVGFGLWRGMKAARVCPSCKAETLQRQREVLQAATRLHPGNGIEHLTCTGCGFRNDRPYTIARRSGGGGGGSSSGFGGGSSSGGGASGKW